MIQQYFRLFWRYYKKNPISSTISLFSLALGISCAVIMLLYINNELGYDRFHQYKDQIYRVSMKMTSKDSEDIGSFITAAVGPDIASTFPEVQSYCRIRNPHSGYLSVKNRSFLDQNIRYCDSTFFDVFSFELLHGNPHTALAQPFSIVLDESFAQRLFPDEDPMGKTVILDGLESYTVTGIVATVPENSHIQFHNLISFSSLYEDSRMYLGWDGGWQYATYLLLESDALISSLDTKMDPFMFERINKKYEQYGARLDPVFEPLQRIYLHSPAVDNIVGGSVSSIIIFSTISFFVLLLACINFINLGTATGSLRAKEIAVRKVFGGQRKKITFQFLGESILMGFAAMLVALVLIGIILPPVNQFMNKNLVLFNIQNWHILLSLPFIVFFIGFLAGSYPSLYLSAFQPLQIFQGNLFRGLGKQRVRNVLVLIQFLISGILITTTLGLNQQLQFLLNKDLGFSREDKLLIPLVGDQVKSKFELIKQEIKNIPGVQSVSASSDYPGRGLTSNGYLPEGIEEPVMINVLDVDFDFLETYGLEIVNGRGFSRDFPGDRKAYLVNETLIEKYGLTDPIGKTIVRDGPHEIIGVIKDFHFSPLHQRVTPLILTMEPYIGFNVLTIVFQTDNIQGLIDSIQEIWSRIDTKDNFKYSFLSDDLKASYEVPKKINRFLLFLTLIAIFIASMGLFGLASFSNRQRTKEIGLRKVLGAQNKNILKQMLREFSIWVLIANVMAWPLSWLALNKIFDLFAFRITMPYLLFLITTAGMVILAWLTVAYQSFRAANTNPSDSLRYE